MLLKETPWKWVTEIPEEPIDWKTFYSCLFPLEFEDFQTTKEYRQGFEDNLEAIIPYYLYKGDALNIHTRTTLPDHAHFLFSVKRLLILLVKQDKYVATLDLVQKWNVLDSIDRVLELISDDKRKQNFVQDITPIFLNIITAKYKVDKKLDSFSFDCLFNSIYSETILNDFFNYQMKLSNHVVGTTLLEALFNALIVKHSELEPSVKESWCMAILSTICFPLSYEHLPQRFIKKCLMLNENVETWEINEFFRLAVSFIPVLLHEQMDKENQIGISCFSLFKSFIKALTQEKLSLYPSTLDALINRIFEEVTEEDLPIISKLIQSYRTLPKYKIEFLNGQLIYMIPLLFEKAKYEDIISLYNLWFNDKLRKEAETMYPFKLAYSFHEDGDLETAKLLYEHLLENGTAQDSVYNNVALIYRDKDKNIDKALTYFKKAFKIDPESELYKRNIDETERIIKEIAERPKRMEEKYFKKIEKKHRKILFSIYKLSDLKPLKDEVLAQATGFGTYFSTLINKLIELDMIQKNPIDGYTLDPTIEQLVKNFIDPKLERKIIKHDENRFYRPIFYHESEIFLYRVLVELFPQHLVFPNMDLKTIIDVDKMRDSIDPDQMEYMFKAHVDFAIIDTVNYFPIITFEKDSAYQDREPHKSNAIKKDMIFKVAGLPMIRLRYSSSMDFERLKEEVKQVTKELLLEFRNQEDVHSQKVLQQFDLKRFGIYQEEVDIEVIQETLCLLVGDVIYTHIKEIEWDTEQSIVFIKIDAAVKLVIELSQTKIKESLYREIPAIHKIEFVWLQD